MRLRGDRYGWPRRRRGGRGTPSEGLRSSVRMLSGIALSVLANRSRDRRIRRMTREYSGVPLGGLGRSAAVRSSSIPSRAERTIDGVTP